MEEFILFYSWQSDNKDSKRIIDSALNKVKEELKEEGIVLRVDQDTRDREGTENIDSSVLDRIQKADLFLGDVSSISILESEDGKKPVKLLSNPNVMYEYGFRKGAVGTRFCFLVAQLKDGQHIQQLPFDINHDTISSFNDKLNPNTLLKIIRKYINSIRLEKHSKREEYGCKIMFDLINESYTVHPEFLKVTHVSYMSGGMEHEDKQKSYRKRIGNICPLPLYLQNTGEKALENCEVFLSIEDAGVTFADSNVKDTSAIGFRARLVTATEITQNSTYKKFDIINPTRAAYIEDVFVKVPYGIKSILIKWHVVSKTFRTEGECTVNVDPEIIPVERVDKHRFGSEIVPYIEDTKLW